MAACIAQCRHTDHHPCYVTFTGIIGWCILNRTVFSIPGIGREVILAVERSDFPVIKAITIYVASATMLFNLLTDLLYQAVDPRVKLS